MSDRDKPNLLFIMLDCMRADYFYGERGPHLPGLNSLLRRGRSFDNFYSVATTTTPCTATVLTGLYPINHGVRGHLGFRLRPDVQTLGEYLQTAGYHTVARTTGPLGVETDIHRGFTDYQHRSTQETIFDNFGQRFWQELDRLNQEKQPWFYFLHVWVLHMPLPAPWREKITYQFPHGPILAAAQWLDLALLTRLWSLVKGRRKGKNQSIVRSDKALGSRRRQIKHFGRQILHLYKKVAYERTLAALDRTLFSTLAQRLDFDKTALAIIGDHGEFVDPQSDGIATGYKLYRRPDHSYHVYEYLTRVPFFLAGPGMPEGEASKRLANQTDLAPTLLAGLEAAPPGPNFDGHNLLANDWPVNRPLFFESVGGGHLEGGRYLRAVRDGDWKFVEAPWMPDYQEELYHLASDPYERHNLRQQELQTAERLRTLLQKQFAPDGQTLGSTVHGATQMDAEDMIVVEERLRELGYLD